MTKSSIHNTFCINTFTKWADTEMMDIRSSTRSFVASHIHHQQTVKSGFKLIPYFPFFRPLRPIRFLNLSLILITCIITCIVHPIHHPPAGRVGGCRWRGWDTACSDPILLNPASDAVLQSFPSVEYDAAIQMDKLRLAFP